MIEAPPALELYDSLIESTGTARRAELYEAAFHGLAGALHAAEVAGEVDRVRYVTQQAAEIHDWLSRHHPRHQLGADSARLRGQTDVFSTLIVHTQSIVTRLRAAKVVERARAQNAVTRHLIPVTPPDTPDRGGSRQAQS